MSVRYNLKIDTDNGGGYAYVGAEIYGRSSVPFFQICRELKTALKE